MNFDQNKYNTNKIYSRQKYIKYYPTVLSTKDYSHVNNVNTFYLDLISNTDTLDIINS